MQQPAQGNTAISIAEATKRINAWKNCLPGNLSNLFYYLEEDGGIHRINNYFELGADGIEQLKAPPASIKYIRIYLGCEDGDSGQVFSPVLSIVTEGQEFYYDLVYQKIKPKPGKIQPGIQITPAIADLFQINWDELNDTELVDAFEGVTYTSWPVQSPSEFPVIHRVNYYDFCQEDVVLIQDGLQSNDKGYLRLCMGAGLTVQITHPFNFRPIIAIPLPANFNQPLKNTQNPLGEAYFERSRPCPPFCPD